ncbi:Uncharacterised protein [Vibrio cholerae]|nr:Uncharacterised protein [Vibrio cholerae]
MSIILVSVVSLPFSCLMVSVIRTLTRACSSAVLVRYAFSASAGPVRYIPSPFALIFSRVM